MLKKRFFGNAIALFNLLGKRQTKGAAMKQQLTRTPSGLFIVLLFVALLALACGNETNQPANTEDGDESESEIEKEAETDGPIAVKAPGNWNPNEAVKPTGIHLTYQHDPATTITLQWATTDHNLKTYKPKVWLVPAALVPGADPTKFEQDLVIPYVKELIFEGRGERYCTKILCATGKDDGVLWVTEATGLLPDTDYYYRAGTFLSFDEKTGEFAAPDLSPVYHFRTGLPKGDKTSFVIGFGSDSQNWFPTFGDDLKIIRETYGNRARFWLYGGDITETYTEQDMSNWFDVMQPFNYYFVGMPVQGNHGIFAGESFGRFTWPMMGPPLPPEDQKHAWSFNYGNAHFVGLDSTNDDLVARDTVWLEADLAAARADKDITWIVVVYHIPPYSSSTSHGSSEYIQQTWVPIFDKYAVDLSLSGHDHDYERTKPLKGGVVVPDGQGTVYIVSGGFYAQKCYGNGTSDFTAVSFDGQSKSHLMLTFGEKTLVGQAYKGNHEALDNFTLTK